MDFIERLLGISPDGGDGSTELMYFVAFAAIVLALSWRWLMRAVRARPSVDRNLGDHQGEPERRTNHVHLLLTPRADDG